MRTKRPSTTIRGQEAEQFVAEYLKQLGWKIIQLNYRTRLGEIDIIAEEQKSLVLIEVKSGRTTSRMLSEKVNHAKRQKLIRAALEYLQDADSSKWDEIRFDVILTVKGGEAGWKVEHIRNAFGMENQE